MLARGPLREAPSASLLLLIAALAAYALAARAREPRPGGVGALLASADRLVKERPTPASRANALVALRAAASASRLARPVRAAGDMRPDAVRARLALTRHLLLSAQLDPASAPASFEDAFAAANEIHLVHGLSGPLIQVVIASARGERDPAAAFARLDRAAAMTQALVPSRPFQLQLLGRIELERGRAAEAERLLDESLRLEPRDRATAHWLSLARERARGAPVRRVGERQRAAACLDAGDCAP